MKPSEDFDTVEIGPALEGGLPTAAIVATADVKVEVAGLSHAGKVRTNNEDAYIVARADRSFQTLGTNLPADDVPRQAAEVAYGLAVADGMGGHAAGEVASRVALSTLVRAVLETPDWIMRDSDRDVERIEKRIAERYNQADEAVSREAEADPRLAGMGTTMTLAISGGSTLFLGHIGDSRAYLLRGMQLHRLTRDHSFAQALVDSGAIAPNEAKSRGVKNILLRYLGTGRGRVATDVEHFSLATGDQVLLCTDGLTDMIDDDAIAHILKRAVTAKGACQALVEAALEAGGHDNITVVLARYRW
jgi:serine/threonine protein phosphatase PrpC